MPDNGKEGAGAGSQSKEIKSALCMLRAKNTPHLLVILLGGRVSSGSRIGTGISTSNSFITVIQYAIANLISYHSDSDCLSLTLTQ